MSKKVNIGIIGEFTSELGTHVATNNAIKHSAARLSMSVDLVWLSTESLDSNDETVLRECDGLWASPSSPYKSKEGTLKAIQFTRERDQPIIGT